MSTIESTNKYAMWTDGGARGNPGPAGIGVRIVDLATNTELTRVSEAIGNATNNQAEYRALLAGLEWLSQNKNSAIITLTIYTDSELLAYQVQGRYRVKNTDLQLLYKQVIERLKQFKGFTILPVRREKNQVADKLVNQALDNLAYTK